MDWQCISLSAMKGETMETTVLKQYKLSIDMLNVDSKNVQTIIDMLLPDLAEPLFQGVRYLMARYENKDIAHARALDVECAVYCGHIEIEEVNV